MSDESECRHLPEPVYNPERCGKCGALLRRSAMTQGDASRRNDDAREPVDARLLAAAKFFASWCPQFSERYGAEHGHHLDAIADAERAAAQSPAPDASARGQGG